MHHRYGKNWKPCFCSQPFKCGNADLCSSSRAAPWLPRGSQVPCRERRRCSCGCDLPWIITLRAGLIFLMLQPATSAWVSSVLFQIFLPLRNSNFTESTWIFSMANLIQQGRITAHYYCKSAQEQGYSHCGTNRQRKTIPEGQTALHVEGTLLYSAEGFLCTQTLSLAGRCITSPGVTEGRTGECMSSPELIMSSCRKGGNVGIFLRHSGDPQSPLPPLLRSRAEVEVGVQFRCGV